MPTVPMKVALNIYLTISRLSTILSLTPVMIAFSIFFATNSAVPPIWNWETNSFGLYHVLSLIYILIDGIHRMILGYRTTSYDNLITAPMLPTWLTPDTVVSTDKKFSVYHVIWCFFAGVIKGTISYSQARYFTQDLLYQVIFWGAFSMACLVIVSEIMMMIFIYQGLESNIVSISTGADVELVQTPDGYKYLFRVRNLESLNTAF